MQKYKVTIHCTLGAGCKVLAKSRKHAQEIVEDALDEHGIESLENAVEILNVEPYHRETEILGAERVK